MNLTFKKIDPELERILLSLDGCGYKGYISLQEKTFSCFPFIFKFERVQGDPFARPTRISVTFDLKTDGFPFSWYKTPLRQLALEDFLLRRVNTEIKNCPKRKMGSGKSGLVMAMTPGQKILKRNAVLISGNLLTVILFAGLPADGRRILGRECIRLFSEILPQIWHKALRLSSINPEDIKRHFKGLEDYTALQQALIKNDWVAFVGDNSLLPRVSGISDEPLKKGGVIFMAPQKHSASVGLPHRGNVRGMPIPKGITVIVGGGFHGKSTLLKAIQNAVHPHIPGDGREVIATTPTGVKIRAEDGRSLRDLNVSGFMKSLPGVESTKTFSTQSASGSTSQAANILEAMESGCDLLLMDEDTCATNFMVRDSKMQKLIHADKEPITPFIDRIEEMFLEHGVSCILVMGGCGDYFEHAGYVIAMDSFRPQLVTDKAKKIVRESPSSRSNEVRVPFSAVRKRTLDPSILKFNRGKKECVIEAYNLDKLVIGCLEIDVRYLEQLMEVGQLEACGWFLRNLKSLMDQKGHTNVSGLKKLFAEFEGKGFASLSPFNNGLMALPRLQEVLAVLNRIR